MKKEAKEVQVKQMMILIPEDLKKRFKEHCQENGYNISARLRALMKKDMEKK